MTTLYIIDGHDEKRKIELTGDSLILGRSPESDFQIKDPFVSRKHLRVSRKGAKIFIKDLHSRNGTFVNGNPIHPGVEVELPQGVPVVTGMSVICFGEGCAEELQDFLGSIDASGLEPEQADGAPEDRPLTPQKNMELMIRVSDLLTGPTNIRETLKEILNCILDLLIRIDRAAVILLDPGDGTIKEVISRMREGVDDQRFSTEVLNHVMKFKEAFIISDADGGDEHGLPSTLKLFHVKSVMCIPLMNRAKLLGVLYVDSIRKPYGFRGEDLHLLSTMSKPVATAIENAFPG